MPFKSKSQMRFMYAKHPDIAKRWEDKYGISKTMPEKVSLSKRAKNLRKKGK